MLVKLIYTSRDGKEFTKLVNPRLIDTVEPDPRTDAHSRSIVKLSTGEKLYCIQTPEELETQMGG